MRFPVTLFLESGDESGGGDRVSKRNKTEEDAKEEGFFFVSNLVINL